MSKLSEEKCHLKEELEEATLKREQQEIKTDGKDMVMHYIVCILINKNYKADVLYVNFYLKKKKYSLFTKIYCARII